MLFFYIKLKKKYIYIYIFIYIIVILQKINENVNYLYVLYYFNLFILKKCVLYILDYNGNRHNKNYINNKDYKNIISITIYLRVG